MAEQKVRFVISVVSRDEVGIIARVSEALYALGANLEALSQTVVWHWFTMIICAEFPAEVSAPDIKAAIEKAGQFTATVLPSEKEPAREPMSGEPFVVTASGADKPGIVFRLTKCFADKGINVEDVWNEVREGRFMVIFHVTMPAHVDPKDARYELEQAGNEAGVSITLQHQDIFTATNSLEVHTKR
ncbi:MAG: hypothetical protein JXR94_10340 [Candidatus Hydrogenedentes bacterium]|nr:hypothetical protein [Candidatus Hydrogenedentota bacterium]